MLRVLQFFNPVVMIDSADLPNRKKKVCDYIAIESNGKSETLSKVIEMPRTTPEDVPTSGPSGLVGDSRVLKP